MTIQAFFFSQCYLLTTDLSFAMVLANVYNYRKTPAAEGTHVILPRSNRPLSRARARTLSLPPPDVMSRGASPRAFSRCCLTLASSVRSCARGSRDPLSLCTINQCKHAFLRKRLHHSRDRLRIDRLLEVRVQPSARVLKRLHSIVRECVEFVGRNCPNVIQVSQVNKATTKFRSVVISEP